MTLHLVARGGSDHLVTRRHAMPIPIVCLDARLRQWTQTFRICLSKPQYQHFVTVLFGFILCQEGRTLSGLARQSAGGPSVASLSRFLAHAPWQPAPLVQVWLHRFRAVGAGGAGGASASTP